MSREKMEKETMIVGEGLDMELPNGLFLVRTEKGLTLVGDGMELRGDFTGMIRRLKQNNLSRELLVRTAKIKGKQGNLTAIDATAGLGEDALLLAAAGFYVTLYEYNPVIALLLEDAIERGKQVSELKECVSRMTLVKGDSIENLKKQEESPDVILLDPMFPERQKSALVKRKFQLLQQLECPCDDEDALLEAAIAAHPHKLIVKRPVKGSYLGGRKPSHSLKGKAIRYDCYVNC